MSKARKLTMFAAAGWLVCFFLLARLFAVSGPNDYRTAQAAITIVLLIVSGWLTGRAALAARRGE